MEDFLAIGDIVCLYSMESYGFLFSNQTSSAFNQLAVPVRQDKINPGIHDQHVISFEICVANRYKLNKSWAKAKAQLNEDPNNLKLRAAEASAKDAAQVETEDNDQEQRRQKGRKVLYGQVVQLRHLFTGKYIHVSTTKTSFTESSNMAVELLPQNAKHAQFKIMPRYKVKAEGDIVQVDDQIVFESYKSPGSFLHASKSLFPPTSTYSKCHELNLSVQQTGFTVYRKYKPLPGDDEKLKIGNVIRFFHKELEAYIVAEGLFNEELQEDVHLRFRPMDQTIPKTMFPSTSAITYWLVESHTGPVAGGLVKWEQPCKIIHLATRMYLMVTEDMKLGLTADHEDSRTIFKMHPVFKESDYVLFDSYVRIEHVDTHFWIHATRETYKRKREVLDADQNSMASFKWSTAELYNLTMIEEKQYDDAFTIQIVEDEHLDIFNYVAGIVPPLQHIIHSKQEGNELTAKSTQEIVTVLQEIRAFFFDQNEPVKARQKLIRNLQVVELLVKFLQTPLRGAPDQGYLTTIFAEAYNVLYGYLTGDSRKNELYIARHIDFFLTQFELKEGSIGLNAAHMVMELIKDNRKIVDRITHEHIDQFVELLQREKNYRYLDLLSVLCVCEDVSISDNQKYITEVWLMKGNRNCVFYTDLGQKIGKRAGVVYVSSNMGRTWQELAEFVRKTKEGDYESYLFLEHQLELYGTLCHGQNDFSIKVITQELNYLTWEEGFTCLCDNTLPDRLRALYCNLITTMFVDISENQATTDRVKLSYIYDDIDQFEDVVDRSKSSTYQYFDTLSNWISGFLAKNSDMVASQIGNNMLVKEVLRLVHYLVSFGFYYKQEDIALLLEPLMGLLDGRNDKPYPDISGSEGEALLKHFRQIGRFQRSPETQAVVNAKCMALEVLDLFFDFVLNLRLEKFIYSFKITHTQYNSTGFFTFKPELGPMLYEGFDPQKDMALAKIGVKKVNDIFEVTAFLKHYNLTDVLQDLCKYNYDLMITKSMMLLNRYYSAYHDLFSRAVQAQVCITDRSVEVYHILEKTLPKMRLYASSARLSDAQTVELCSMLDSYAFMCYVNGEVSAPHKVNQVILYNHGILEECFTIVQQPFDVKLMDQFAGQKKILQKTFILLKYLSRLNSVVQMRLFDRLDMLLNIRGVEEELAEALCELFTGNTKTCMKVTAKQVQRIMSIVAQCKNEVPQYLDLLNAIVKVEELDLPIKRNQGFVMQYFMQYRNEVAYVIDQAEEKRSRILMDPGHSDLMYLVSMMDMLATCAEGENQFIESICQTIFKIPELLRILNNKKVNDDMKRPFLRYFLWVYLNSAGGKIDSGTGELPHDKNMWEFINGLNETLKNTSEYMKAEPEKSRVLLRNPPSRNASAVVNPEEIARGSMWYIFEAVVPFVQIFCKDYFQPDGEMYPKELKWIDELTISFRNFMEEIAPLISIEKQMKGLTAAVTTLITVSNLPLSEMEEFSNKYGGKTISDVRSDAMKVYDEYYEAENDINAQLNTYSLNQQAAYGGPNTVIAQIGFPSTREYSEVGGDEELYLGSEFQEHLNWFIDKSSKTTVGKYALAEKLVKQLEISHRTSHITEKDKLDQLEIDKKSLQLLRGLLHNEIVKLPENWEAESSKHKKHLAWIEEVQCALNHHGVVNSVLEHLASPSDAIVREVLTFMSTLLYNGNGEVQQSLLGYFTGTREETFFFTIKARMTMSAIATREKRHLFAMHQARMEDAKQQAKALKLAMKTGGNMPGLFGGGGGGPSRFGSVMTMNSKLMSSLMNLKQKGMGSTLQVNGKSPMGSKLSLTDGKTSPNPENSMLNTSINGGTGMERSPTALSGGLTNPGMSNGAVAKQNSVVPSANPPEADVEINDEELKELLGEDFGSGSDDLKFEDDGYIELVLRILGLMCDNQYRDLQDYLREQPDNIKSCNLVAETTRFLDILYSNINDQSMPLTCQLFDTLVEFCSGNFNNQATVFDNKICDYVNHILRMNVFHDCSQLEEYSLKMSIATLLKALSEENPPEKFIEENNPLATLAREVMETLDEHVLVQTLTDAYQLQITLENASSKEKKDEDYEDLLATVTGVGFAFTHIMLRKNDLDPDVNISDVLKTVENLAAWNFFVENSMSIEICKNDVLQKIYFQVRNRKVLREEVKEKFKYDVDRTSPSNKIRGFISWCSDIMHDIKYQKIVLSNPLGRLLINAWIPINYLVLFLSLVICIFMMVTWRDPKAEDGTSSNTNSTVPEYSIDKNTYNYFLYAAGGVHNFLSLLVYITYLLSNRPSFPPYGYFMNLIGRGDAIPDEYKAWHERKKEPNQLAVNVYSVGSLYYIVFFGLSILGTIYYGYFFSFHLLHIAVLNQLLKRVIQAVTTNAPSLMLVALLGLAIMFIYSLVSFAFLREVFFKEEEGRHCRTLYHCFLTIAHHGFVDVPYTTIEAAMGPDFNQVLMVSFIDITFFILITTIGLNIIFGIIVDTFSQLRDMKWEIDKDMQNNCFICSLESYEFERQGKGFTTHVKTEHNQWAYLFFFLHLDQTRPNDYSSLELYVSNMLQENKYEFFPLNRALCLQGEQFDVEKKVDLMREDVLEIERKINEQTKLLSFVVNTLKEQQRAAIDQIKAQAAKEYENLGKKKKGGSGGGGGGPPGGKGPGPRPGPGAGPPGRRAPSAKKDVRQPQPQPRQEQKQEPQPAAKATNRAERLAAMRAARSPSPSESEEESRPSSRKSAVPTVKVEKAPTQTSLSN